jgi:hypothetical protein
VSFACGDGLLRGVAGATAVLFLTVVAAGCGTGRGGSASATNRPASGSAAPSTAGAAPITPAPTARSGSTTTTFIPTAPQDSASDASIQLVYAWSSGNRALADAVASPAAVSALFAVPYPGQGLALSRGCSVAFPPLVCTYGPPGGASPEDSIYQLYVSQTSKGWYVSSVSVEP